MGQGCPYFSRPLPLLPSPPPLNLDLKVLKGWPAMKVKLRMPLFLSPRRGEPDLGMVCTGICRVWKQLTGIWDHVRYGRDIGSHTGQPSPVLQVRTQRRSGCDLTSVTEHLSEFWASSFI